jgi:D-alanine-D-alanine ligase
VNQIKGKYESYSVWILIPQLEAVDENIAYYYDFDQSFQEYNRVFDELKVEWHWQPVSLKNFSEVLSNIKQTVTTKIPLIINLCDGDEINDTPGVSVIHELERLDFIYTGAQSYFYDITTSKIDMKVQLDNHHVPNADWEVIQDNGENIQSIFERLGKPLIIKPAISGGSMGLGIKNVVQTEEECMERFKEMKCGYRGWNLAAGGIFIERFIQGREFTTLLVGSFQQPDKIKCYTPVERVFSKNIPKTEQILSFDRLWETYDDEKELAGNEFLFNYFLPEAELIPQLNQLSLETYISLKGTGYTRIDIRMDESTGKMFVLEANAQCGLSEDENYTSIGAIIRLSSISFTQLIADIMDDAINRKVS